jgi:hypothetical protein
MAQLPADVTRLEKLLRRTDNNVPRNSTPAPVVAEHDENVQSSIDATINEE